MKWFLASFICLTQVLMAATPSKEQPAYDADLFKRDTSVFSVHGSFLFWRVQEGALDYALKMEHPGVTGYAQGKFHNATFNGDPGFRVALSYFRAPKYWEIWGQYTRMTSRGKNSVGAPGGSGEFLNGTWPQFITAPITHAESHIHLNYNVADLLVDRFFNPNPHLRIRFLGGGSAAWISQNWHIHYENAATENTLIRNWWRFIGGGVRIGSMIDWFCGFDTYLTATVTGATFLGTYENKARQTASTSTLPIRDSHFSDVRSAFTVQAIFGPSWQKNFASSRMEIFAGYEINTWFNLQEVYRSTLGAANTAKETLINNSLIALQGLTARMTIDF